MQKDINKEILKELVILNHNLMDLRELLDFRRDGEKESFNEKTQQIRRLQLSLRLNSKHLGSNDAILYR